MDISRVIIKLIVIIFAVVIVGYSLRVIYDTFKTIYYGYKHRWNKIYLTISLIMLISSMPFVIKKDYARITVMIGFGSTLYFINKSKRNVSN